MSRPNTKADKKQKTKFFTNTFYHAFDKKTKKRLIKDGALSGCIVGLSDS